MSPRRNWDSSTPSLASEFAPPHGTKGGTGAHSPAGEGLGESQFRRLEKKAEHSAYSVEIGILCIPVAGNISIAWTWFHLFESF
jgi:hypothetical protein